MTGTMDIIKTYTLKKYNVYKFIKNHLHMNQIDIDTYNQIFRKIEKMNTI